MSAVDPRIDAFIAKAEPFARPILSHLRDMIHRACPGVTETIKWSRPAFENEGRVLAVLGAFKAHASLHLWRMGEAGERTGKEAEGSGQFGRLTSLADLPDEDELIRIIQATAIVRSEAKPKPKAPPRPDLPVPEELAVALDRAPSARAAWDAFSPSHRREYSEWIGEAKRPETRAARVAQAIEWLAEGKSRNWKYQR
jgi:uncharacterized protein YdeI (YjbR/CyaY-like superfamily)